MTRRVSWSRLYKVSRPKNRGDSQDNSVSNVKVKTEGNKKFNFLLIVESCLKDAQRTIDIYWEKEYSKNRLLETIQRLEEIKNKADYEKQLCETSFTLLKDDINTCNDTDNKQVLIKKLCNEHDLSIDLYEELTKIVHCFKERFKQVDLAPTKVLTPKNKQQENIDRLKSKAAVTVRKKRRLVEDIKRRITKNKFCPYCGNILDYTGLDVHLDHIYPVSKGGESVESNLVYVCASCNMKKGNMTLRNFIKVYGLDRDFIEDNLDALSKDF